MMIKRANKPQRPTWTSSQLCEALGLSSGELGRRVLDGSIKGKVSYGKFDALAAVRSMVDSLKADLARANQSDDAAIKNARLRWFAARAETSELELAQKRGALLDAEETTRAFRNAVIVMRSHLLGLPSVLAPILAATNEPARCNAILADRIARALTELANAPVVVEPCKNGRSNEGMARL